MAIHTLFGKICQCGFFSPRNYQLNKAPSSLIICTQHCDVHEAAVVFNQNQAQNQQHRDQTVRTVEPNPNSVSVPQQTHTVPADLKSRWRRKRCVVRPASDVPSHPFTGIRLLSLIDSQASVCIVVIVNAWRQRAKFDVNNAWTCAVVDAISRAVRLTHTWHLHWALGKQRPSGWMAVESLADTDTCQHLGLCLD